MKEKIILKSTNPKEYGDLVIECRVIPNDQIGSYLAGISDDKKFVACKTGKVRAQVGMPGEKVMTTLKTVVDGKEYIISEEEGTVKEREVEVNGEKKQMPDVVVTNISSTSNEKYVVNYPKFLKTYEPTEEEGVFTPAYDARVLTQIDENVIIVTAWGSKALCLAGSYIVTYDESINDYNTLEKGAYDSTYTKVSSKVKIK